MCLICISVQKDSMTAKEIARAYLEWEFEEMHYLDVMAELQKKGLLEEVASEISKQYLKNKY